MKVGVLLPNAGPKASVDHITEVARHAEALGFHSVWTSDHVLIPEHVESYYPYRANGRWDYPPDSMWMDPLLSLAWAAAAAPSLLVGTAVLVAPLRHPVLLAKQVSTLDVLTGGRVILGLGAGWMKEEADVLGSAFENRGNRLQEMIEVMRHLWTGERAAFHGRYWTVTDARMHPTPVRRVPIALGGHSPAAIRRAARVADAWLPHARSPDQLRVEIAQLRAECERSGRNSVEVIVQSGRAYQLTPEFHAIHQELGVDHVILDTQVSSDDQSEFIDAMRRWAEITALTPPSS